MNILALKAALYGRALTKRAALKPDVTLLPHQERVVSKWEGEAQPPGMLIYHGLGSGKTPTSIAVGETMPGIKNVVVPAALRENYRKQLRQFSTDPRKYRIMSYTEALKGKAEAPFTVFDEAHRMGREGTAMSMLPRRMPGRKLLLTGTPVRNEPSEIVPLLKAISSDRPIPQTQEAFDRQFIGTQTVRPDLLSRIFLGVKPGERQVFREPEQFKKLVEGRVDYQPSRGEFPSSAEKHVDVDMTPAQSELYRGVMGGSSLAWKIRLNLPPSKSEAAQLNSFLSGVRQVSNNPAAYDTRMVGNPVDHSPKLQRMIDDVQKGLKNTTNFKGLVYSNYLDAGIVPMSAHLTKLGIPNAIFTGEMNDKLRKKVVDDYNKGDVKVLLVSGAGSEGLDLKGTKMVQVMEPHWNLARTKQVIGRAIRHQSHAHLPPEERFVTVNWYHSKPKQSFLSSWGLLPADRGVDRYLYSRAVEKQQIIDQMLGVLRDAGTKPKPQEAPLAKAAFAVPDPLLDYLTSLAGLKKLQTLARKYRVGASAVDQTIDLLAPPQDLTAKKEEKEKEAAVPADPYHDLDKLYETFDKAHGPSHQQAVRDRARMLAARHAPKMVDLADLGARLHDIGISKGREGHEQFGAEMVANDPRFSSMAKWKHRLLVNAIRQHRASTGKPRSILGRIVSDADRMAGTDTATALQRAVNYGRVYEPHLDEEGQYRRALAHLAKKFGPEGTGRRHYFPETNKMLSSIYDPIIELNKKNDIESVRKIIAGHTPRYKEAASDLSFGSGGSLLGQMAEYGNKYGPSGMVNWVPPLESKYKYLNAAIMKRINPIKDPAVKRQTSRTLLALLMGKQANYDTSLPDPRRFGDPRQIIKNKLLEWVVQEHIARRSGRHLDVRFGEPGGGPSLYSWATKKELPKPGEKPISLFQQPLHRGTYADFQGTIPSGYGAGEVKQYDRGKISVTEATRDRIKFMTHHKSTPEYFTLVRRSGVPKNPQTARMRSTQGGSWLLINTTPANANQALPEDSPQKVAQAGMTQSALNKLRTAIGSKTPILRDPGSEDSGIYVHPSSRQYIDNLVAGLPAKTRKSVTPGMKRLLRRHGIIYGSDVRSPAVAAHEMGHATGSNMLLPVEATQMNLSPLFSGLMASTMAAHTLRNQPTGLGSSLARVGLTGAIGAGAGLLFHSPTLIEEGRASLRGLKALRDAGFSDKDVTKAREDMWNAYKSYLSHSALRPAAYAALGTGAALGISGLRTLLAKRRR